MGIQGVGQLRCAVGHPSVADSAASVGRQFRANRDHRVPGRIGLAVSGGTPNSGQVTIGNSATLIYLDPVSANREDNIWVVDTRVEKTFKFVHNLQFRGFVDLFNITNSHASETIGRATGISYLKPTLILAPRTLRFGFRMMW